MSDPTAAVRGGENREARGRSDSSPSTARPTTRVSRRAGRWRGGARPRPHVRCRSRQSQRRHAHQNRTASHLVPDRGAGRPRVCPAPLGEEVSTAAFRVGFRPRHRLQARSRCGALNVGEQLLAAFQIVGDRARRRDWSATTAQERQPARWQSREADTLIQTARRGACPDDRREIGMASARGG